MMFKNLTIFTIPKGWAPTQEELQSGQFEPCTSQQMQSSGWGFPRYEGEFIATVNGQHLLALTQEKRLLPASVVNQAHRERIKQIEKETGRKPSRKEAKELREDLELELMPRAFTVRNTTNVWVDPVNGFLVGDSATPSVTDEVGFQLMQSLEGVLMAHQFTTHQMPGIAMSAWMESGEPPAGFTIDMDCEMVGSEQNAVKFKNEYLVGRDEVLVHLKQGKVPSALAMTYNSRVSFILTVNNVLKRVQLLDIVKDSAQSAQDADEQFEVDFTLMAAEYADLINALADALGGLVERPKE